LDVEAPEEAAERTPLKEVQVDDELWGEVTKVSNYGAFVDVGVEVPGFLHIIYYPKKLPVSIASHAPLPLEADPSSALTDVARRLPFVMHRRAS
jgi:predicted RNA-binding protein (virulence factor B family)